MNAGDPVTAIVDGRAACGYAGAPEHFMSNDVRDQPVFWMIDKSGFVTRALLAQNENKTWLRGHDIETMEMLAAAHKLVGSAG